MTSEPGPEETVLISYLKWVGDPALNDVYQSARKEIIAQARREALEEVCKMQCCMCDCGFVPKLHRKLRDNGAGGYWRHSLTQSSLGTICAAWRIRDLMEEIK